MKESPAAGAPGPTPRDPAYEARIRESFARQGIMAHLGATLQKVGPGRVEIAVRSGRTLTICRFDAYVEKGGQGTHCATGMQTLMAVVGRAGVRG